MALGASLHAVGQHASIATSTLAAVIGGAIPVSGGPDVALPPRGLLFT